VIFIMNLVSLIGKKFYEMAQTLDANFQKLKTMFADSQPPQSPAEGMMFYDTAEKKAKRFLSENWKRVLEISYIQSASPASPQKDELWIDTSGDKSILKIYTGAGWTNLTTIGQISINNILSIPIELTGLQDGYVLKYSLSQNKFLPQEDIGATGTNASSILNKTVEADFTNQNNDSYILVYQKTSDKFILLENTAAKLKSDTGGKTYNDIITAMTDALQTHTSDASAHHAKYTNDEARNAMGVKSDGNPLNHNRYTDSEARAAMGAEANANPFNHNRYTDSEANAALANYIAPIASIIAWAKNIKTGLTIPACWVECNGQTLNDSESILNGILIPNLNGQNRFLRGNSTSGETGGEEKHTLTINEMPRHNHDINAGGSSGVASGVQPTPATTPTPSYSNLIRYTGDDAPHENRPPFYDIVWIIRIK